MPVLRAVARVLNMHQVALRERMTGVNYLYHANDNAFLNYGDVWFDQRTLTVCYAIPECAHLILFLVSVFVDFHKERIDRSILFLIVSLIAYDKLVC